MIYIAFSLYTPAADGQSGVILHKVSSSKVEAIQAYTNAVTSSLNVYGSVHANDLEIFLIVIIYLKNTLEEKSWDIF